jgi:hypothetical protein
MKAGRIILWALAALAAFPATASADITCTYHEDGADGPLGNTLIIRGDGIEDQAALVRRGNLIVVTDDRTGESRPCQGQQATVRNINSITFNAAADGAGLFVSLAGGPFAPGAQPPGTSDPSRNIRIEFRSVVRFPGNVGVGGTRRGDVFEVVTPPPGRGFNGINLDADDDDQEDLVFLARGMVGALLRTGAGADRISGARLKRRISLSVYAGAGADRIVGGPMTDFLLGGRGADRIKGRGGADEVGCGLGFDFARAGPNDRLTGCERVLRPAAGRIAFP